MGLLKHPEQNMNSKLNFPLCSGEVSFFICALNSSIPFLQLLSNNCSILAKDV